MEHEKSHESPLWYVLGGLGIGVVLGLLFAPKKGSELRADIAEWDRVRRETGRRLLARLGSMVPLRVKAAAALGAVKAGGAEAIREIKESFSHDGASNG